MSKVVGDDVISSRFQRKLGYRSDEMNWEDNSYNSQIGVNCIIPKRKDEDEQA